MEVTEAVRRRRMVRSFDPGPVEAGLVDRLLDDALRAPTAGNAGATSWLVLDRPADRDLYWDRTTTADWRARSRRWPGLSRAPVVVLSLTSETAYRRRYAEADKAGSGLGDPRTDWPVPYWFADAGCAVMTLLLLAAEAGLGAGLLGNFRGEAALKDALGIPPEQRLFATVLLGRPDGADHRSASLARPADRRHRVHHGRWAAPAAG